jgi:hypothetical protein
MKIDPKRTPRLERRSGVIEQWLRRAAKASAEQEINDATATYYRSIRSENNSEDEPVARALSRAAAHVAYDDAPTKRPRARR